MGDYYKTKETAEEYIRLAEGFNGQYLIDKLTPYLKTESTILELGSGPGKDYEILNQSFEVTGSDNSKEFIKYLEKTYPNGNFELLDASAIETKNTYDVVYSNKVMHHLNDSELEISISRQYEILNPNGIICHSFWKGEGSEVFKGLFVNYHLEKDLQSVIGGRFHIHVLER